MKDRRELNCTSVSFRQGAALQRVCVCVCMCTCMAVCVAEKISASSPEGSVVQCCVSVFILDFDGAVGLQQGLHHLHVALVSSDLQCSLALVLYIHLAGTQTAVEDLFETMRRRDANGAARRLAGK